MAWAIDRLGRSLIDLLGTIQTLEHCGIDLYLDQQAIEHDHAGRPTDVSNHWCVCRVRRSMIRQRINAGLERAVEQHDTVSTAALQSCPSDPLAVFSDRLSLLITRASSGSFLIFLTSARVAPPRRGITC
jgi:DNA invertase Pin-like site-specific DNA recombinase